MKSILVSFFISIIILILIGIGLNIYLFRNAPDDALPSYNSYALEEDEISEIKKIALEVFMLEEISVLRNISNKNIIIINILEKSKKGEPEIISQFEITFDYSSAPYKKNIKVVDSRNRQKRADINEMQMRFLSKAQNVLDKFSLDEFHNGEKGVSLLSNIPTSPVFYIVFLLLLIALTFTIKGLFDDLFL